jgi:hypothetical protein
MSDKTCQKCGKYFAVNQGLKRHQARKTPCAPVLDMNDLLDEQKDSPNRCKFCGRVFVSKATLTQHIRKSCKIAPRKGNVDGMEKLYEHVIKRQAALDAEVKMLKAQSCTSIIPSQVDGTALIDTIIAPKNNNQTIIVRTANIDQSVGKTTNNITINVFGQEKIDRITKPDVFKILRGLGPVGENIKAIAEKAIIQAAMLIFSDPAHPEDITCYLPNKKSDNALVHGETGWEVQPVGLVISPMATKAIDALFAQQPAPDTETPANDVKWMMNECGNIMRYIMNHEGDITNTPPRGEMRGILIRNKELLNQVLTKLPMAGQK